MEMIVPRPVRNHPLNGGARARRVSDRQVVNQETHSRKNCRTRGFRSLLASNNQQLLLFFILRMSDYKTTLKGEKSCSSY
jgi:hypothetical protein